MFRVLFIAILSLATLGACSQTADPNAGFRHAGNGPPFSSRISP